MLSGQPVEEVVVRAVGSGGGEFKCRIEREMVPGVGYRMRAILDGQPPVEVEAGDYFEALRLIRRQFEEDGLRLCCAGARRDVWASGMQRDMGGGLTAYVLSLPRIAARPAEVSIFEPAPLELVATVVDQERFFESWWNSPLAD